MSRVSPRPRWKRLVLLTLAIAGPAALSLAGVEAADPAPLRVIADTNPNFSGIWVDTVNDELVVTDDSHHRILVYARTASGPAAPLRQVQGNSTQLDFPASVVVDVTNNEIWSAMNDTSERATVHSRTANDNAAPLRVIAYAPLRLPSTRSWGWALDTLNDEVAGAFQRNPGAVSVFDRATGAPLRDINGPGTQLNDPHGIFIDNVNDEIFVTNEGHILSLAPDLPSITVYDRLDAGDVAPKRIIQGPATGLNVPKHIHMDLANNEMAVANGGSDSVTVYARAASGDTAPLRTLAGSLTGLSNPTGVFLDATNGELLVTNWGNHSITVYPRTAGGNVAPLRTITASPGGAQVGLGNPGAMSLDLTNNEIAVVNCVTHPRVAIFDRLDSGQVAPRRIISGPATRLSRSTHGVWIDPVNDEIAVPSGQERAILIFDRLAAGNAAPIRVIQGPNTNIEGASRHIMVDTVNDEIVMPSGRDRVTRLQKVSTWDRLADGDVAPKRELESEEFSGSSPIGVWVDATHDEIFVVDSGASPKILVFDRLATGVVASIRSIEGPLTMLNRPTQIALDLTNNEIVVANLGERALDPPVHGSIVVFNRTDSGNVAPKRFIQGPTSGVGFARSVWVDPVNDEIGEADSKFNWIQVFPRFF
jgi:DNA-binding beta-propeller fold protein YncE